MKSQELRIGNLIFRYGAPMEIASIHNDGTFRLKIGEDTIGCYNCSDAKPIPLTEEWLVKLGFTNINGEFTLKLKTLNFLSFDFYTGLYLKSYGGGELELIDIDGIKYVHQLQNLYFALTGEELCVKE